MANLGWEEKIFAYAGLNTPFQRLIAGGLLVTGIVFAIKPAALFEVDGTARPWKLLDKTAPNATWVPWWAYPIAAGTTMSVFV